MYNKFFLNEIESNKKKSMDDEKMKYTKFWLIRHLGIKIFHSYLEVSQLRIS